MTGAVTSRPARSFSIHVRANHATSGPEPARRTVGGARRPTRRWLPRPRAVAAGGALLAQLWGFGAPGACAAGAEPLPEPAGRTVGRTLTGGGAPADGPSAARPAGVRGGGPAERPTTVHPGPAADGGAAATTARTPSAEPGPPPVPAPSGRNPPAQDPPTGLLEVLPGPAPASTPPAAARGADGANGTAPEPDGAPPLLVSGVLQDRIRAGGLPLPGQRAAVPDAFAIASGLLGTVPAQSRPTEARATRGEPVDGATGGSARSGEGPGTGRTGGDQRRPAAPPPAPTSPDQPRPPVSGHPDAVGTGNGPAARAEHGPVAAGAPAFGPVSAPAGRTTTAAVTVAQDAAGTATAVLAPIAAGLALTGAAMYKHRGLPKGH